MKIKWIPAKESDFNYIQKMDIWHSEKKVERPNMYKQDKPEWCIYVQDGDMFLQHVEKWQFYGPFQSAEDAKTFHREIFNYE